MKCRLGQYRLKLVIFLCGFFACCVVSESLVTAADLPAGRWVELCQDSQGARRGSAVRYAEETGAFYLWGFMDSNPDHLQEHPLMEVPEYDMVALDLDRGRWENQFPPAWEAMWKKKLPLASVVGTYSGITSGSRQTILRSPTDSPDAAPRPDLNIVFDQVVYHPPTGSLVYFTGGLTAAYEVNRRHWSDLVPAHRPPPVVGGSLAYNPIHDEIVLFGGGHVVEPGPEGVPVGYTGTWHYSFAEADWQREEHDVEPPPRMNTRLVCDTKNNQLVLFGGDAQSHYLADTWLYDLETRVWRKSSATAGPPPRAGHFTAYDPVTGLVIIGGGYHRGDYSIKGLSDMWAYDVAKDRWRPLQGKVPTGFYLTADFDPERRVILLVVNTKRPGDRSSCNSTYPVRTTYRYRIDTENLFAPDGIAADGAEPQAHPPMAKKQPAPSSRTRAEETARQTQKRLANLPRNRWVELENPGRLAPTRTWGSATFDVRRNRILYWGGGHCGYGGNDVDSYDVAQNTWRSSDPEPEFPGKLWDRGANPAGITFQGRPWMTHGRRSYATDPVSGRLVMVRLVRLTTGYDPVPLDNYPGAPRAGPGAIVSTPSGYSKWTTWTFDPDDNSWELLCEAPYGMDTLITTPHGAVGVTVSWRERLAASGYLLPWRESQPGMDRAVYRLDVANRLWERLGGSAEGLQENEGLQKSGPQNLYEMTSLAYDSKRDCILLHGGGAERDQLWAFDLNSKNWKNLAPRVANPPGAKVPVCVREAVYLPEEDAMVTVGPATDDGDLLAFWVCRLNENAWYRMKIPQTIPRERIGQNRAFVYDPHNRLMFLVLGMGGNRGDARILAMRYRHREAELFAPQGR